jgi:hypothetical protein
MQLRRRRKPSGHAIFIRVSVAGGTDLMASIFRIRVHPRASACIRANLRLNSFV